VTRPRIGRLFPTGRREFLRRAGSGCGLLALAALLRDDTARKAEGEPEPSPAEGPPHAPAGPSGARPPHFPARARSVIWLFMEGGPSGLDLFDPKPELTRRDGEPLEGIVTNFGTPGPLLASPFTFARHGQSGAPVADVYPSIARCVDDLAFVRSCRAESAIHGTAMYQMNTGVPRTGYPSAGAWVTYGLGSENRNLPGFVVMAPGSGKGGPANWGAGFLPSSHQGTVVHPGGAAGFDFAPPTDLGSGGQRAMLDLAASLNRARAARHPGDAELEARIASFELAFRMQAEAPEALDLSRETRQTHALYGIGTGPSDAFGRKCLAARRLVERGVRFVQVYSDADWDAHLRLKANHEARCAETDVPIAGLLTDLKRRGLLASTLVIWGGEFGRLPISQGSDGRDHNPHGFLVWMAGGGVKGGVSYGETDELGYKAAADPVSVHDLHATVLHLLGLDHKRLTYTHSGRQFRLTDVSGEVLTKVLA
jgi:hypothetical protein